MTYFYDGDDNNGKAQKSQAATGPVQPGELQIPQGVGPILGSDHEAEENRNIL